MLFFKRLKYLLPGNRRSQERDMQGEFAALEQIAGRRELGNLTLASEDTRAVLGFPLLDGTVADIRYGFRTLRRDRAFTIVAVTSLALGIAANVSIFGLMDTLLWRELPIAQPDQLVRFENTSRSYFGYSEFAKHSKNALTAVIAQSSSESTSIDLGSGSTHAQVEFVSGNFFNSLGIRPTQGRLILTSDAEPQQSTQVVVLSNAYWRKAFNADPSAVGRQLHIGNGQFEVVGIAPDEFFGLSVGEAPDVWLPVTAHPIVFAGSTWLSGRNMNWLSIFGRLRPDMTIRRAQSMLTPVSLEIDIERSGHVPTPAQRKEMLQDPMRLEPAAKGLSDLRLRYSKPLHVVFGLLGVGLLLACINVVSLQIARADERRKEFAVRLALGAGRFRVVRQCLIESLIIATLSGGLGCVLFRPATGAIVSLMTIWSGEPARLNLALHSSVVEFVIFLCFTVALISGLIPALYASRRKVQPALQRGSPSTSSARHHRGLIRAVCITQIAVSLVMITGTCLFVFSLHQLRQFDTGIRRDRLLEIDIDPMRGGYKEGLATLLDERLRQRFSAVPAVENVTFSQNGIYSERDSDGSFEAEGFHPAGSNAGHGIYDYVGPHFFTTLGTTILAGRDLNEHDNAAGPRVVIVNQTFAQRVFPNRNPIGRSLYIPDGSQKKAYRIVGVVRDVRADARQTQLTWYLPELQHEQHFFSTRFLIRAKKGKQVPLHDLTAAAVAENPLIRIDASEMADDLLNRTLDTDRLMARLGWAFRILALLLASAGIYGLLSYDVSRRTGEIGIRTALGAFRTDILKLVLSEVLVVTCLGVILGEVFSSILARLVRGMVFGIEAGDPRVELVASFILLAVAFLAAAIPARTAARIEPMNALRAD